MTPRTRRLKQAAVLLAVAFVVLLLVYLAPWEERSPPAKQGLFPYEAIIHRQADAFELDPYLVAAVIDNESGFDPDKKSPEGAVGLMQVMPDTARLGAEALKIKDYTDQSLWEPERNVRLGCWYLRKLMRDFDRDLVAVLAAYNAGPGKVEQWRTAPRWREREGIDRIPLMETRSYVLLVLREYESYRRQAARAQGAHQRNGNQNAGLP